jgi:hypothetical protein
MPGMDPLSSSLRNLWNHVTGSGGPAPATPDAGTVDATTAARSPKDPGAAYDAAIRSLPNPSVALPVITARPDPVGAKLDELQATLKGPYTVMHQTVESGAQFRMVGGYNQARVSATSDDERLLVKVAGKVGLSASDVVSLQAGRGDPRALVKLTQGLIDAGQILGGPDKPLAARIHDVQWRFAVGLDCAGYVYRAVAAIHGDPAKLGLKETLNENFTGLPQNGHFAHKEPVDAKAGDVLVLAGDGTMSNPGHNLIVRSHSMASAAKEPVGKHWKAAADFVGTRSADIHMFEVDSSFGAGATGDPHGGVRRDVLLYDAATKNWCTCRDTDPPVASVGPIPYDEVALTGFYRAKVSR